MNLSHSYPFIIFLLRHVFLSIALICALYFVITLIQYFKEDDPKKRSGKGWQSFSFGVFTLVLIPLAIPFFNASSCIIILIGFSIIALLYNCMYKKDFSVKYVVKDEMDFDVDFNPNTNCFRGKLILENGVECGVEGKFVPPDQLSYTTSSDEIYSHYTGPQLNQLIISILSFGRESSGEKEGLIRENLTDDSLVQINIKKTMRKNAKEIQS